MGKKMSREPLTQLVDYREIKRLVIIRLKTMPPNIKISIGPRKDLSREGLLKEVENETELGKLIIKMQLEYLRSMKNF